MKARTKQKSLSLLLKSYGGFFMFFLLLLLFTSMKELNELE